MFIFPQISRKNLIDWKLIGKLGYESGYVSSKVVFIEMKTRVCVCVCVRARAKVREEITVTKKIRRSKER